MESKIWSQGQRYENIRGSLDLHDTFWISRRKRVYISEEDFRRLRETEDSRRKFLLMVIQFVLGYQISFYRDKDELLLRKVIEE